MFALALKEFRYDGPGAAGLFDHVELAAARSKNERLACLKELHKTVAGLKSDANRQTQLSSQILRATELELEIMMTEQEGKR